MPRKSNTQKTLRKLVRKSVKQQGNVREAFRTLLRQSAEAPEIHSSLLVRTLQGMKFDDDRAEYLLGRIHMCFNPEWQHRQLVNAAQAAHNNVRRGGVYV